MPDFDTAKFAEWLATEAPEHRDIARVEKFKGGQSNPTYRVTTGKGDIVLRRKPFGPTLPSAHAVDREYRVISALEQTPVPVPKTLALCEDDAVIGAPFYVMEMVEGRTFWNGGLPECTREERRGIYRSMIDALADLHSVDPDSVGLSDYGAPGNYFERQVRRWTKQYRAAQTGELAEVERLIEWLPETLPPQQGVSVIHGDYRIDNLIFAKDDTDALAIIDWELSTLGDPLADFAYLAMNWAMPKEYGGAQLGGYDLAELGIPTLEEISARYCERMGRSDLPDLNWYFAYNLFRLVGILQGIRKRIADGNASGADAEQKAALVEPLAQAAWGFAKRAGA
ncbi:phosphotransferase family protein [Aurantiacibacter aquimixticola]|uniref:phosphotransferase family protein n=1 Tax=Aurantiacibacter aquimixticola TaxID=1958945 RepID=UPI003BEEEE6A